MCGKIREKTKTCQSGSANNPVSRNCDSLNFSLHRVSGVITFLAVGILLWLLGHSLASEEGFLYAAAILDSVIVKFILWGILTALAYHIVGGLRHLMMDFGFLKEDLASGNRSARLSFIITVVLSLLAGVLVW